MCRARSLCQVKQLVDALGSSGCIHDEHAALSAERKQATCGVLIPGICVCMRTVCRQREQEAMQARQHMTAVMQDIKKQEARVKKALDKAADEVTCCNVLYSSVDRHVIYAS